MPQIDAEQVVVLGAGRSVRTSGPAALHSTGQGSKLLDWLVSAFGERPVDLTFVGGYRGDEVRVRYPEISFVHNPDWRSTGSASSVARANLKANRVAYLVYGDVIFRPKVIDAMRRSQAEVVLAYDSEWLKRFDGASKQQKQHAEKVQVNNEQVVACRRELDISAASGQFAGIIKLSTHCSGRVAQLLRNDETLAKKSVPHLIEALLKNKTEVRGVDIAGDWAELDAPQDLAQFVLGTKAESLERLRPLVKKGRIGQGVRVRRDDWHQKPEACIQNLRDTLRPGVWIARSSSSDEDAWENSSAGAFESVPDIDSNNTQALQDGIESVFKSYPNLKNSSHVLLQGMVQNVAQSGVVMTRTHSTGGPYYVFNIDSETRRTDTVTSGSATPLRTIFLHRDHQLPPHRYPELLPILAAVKELEALIGHNALDIEFCQSDDGVVHILQVRPMVSHFRNNPVDDTDIAAAIQRCAKYFEGRQHTPPFVVGKRTMLSVMSDWNPAEIIGRKPRRLAFSLYRHLITDSVWAAQRAQNGYRDVRPHPLLVDLLGHPYVDVRATFNSFVPDSIAEPLAEKLVNHYLESLEQDPSKHDKVEFEVLITCASFELDKKLEGLAQNGFSNAERQSLRDGLLHVTKRSIESTPKDLSALQYIQSRFCDIQNKNHALLDQAYCFIEDARCFGTTIFANLARSGFVAVTFLRSMVSQKILSEARVEDFMHSLNTVSTDLHNHAYAVKSGDSSLESLVSRFGHLRPGTYDILSPHYAADVAHYLEPMVQHATAQKNTTAFRPTATEREAIEHELKALDLELSVDAFLLFLKQGIEGREFAKFVFTKNLSAGLEALAHYGSTLNLDRDLLSHVPISDLFALRDVHRTDEREFLLARGHEGRDAYHISQALCFPGFLASKEELYAYEQAKAVANFVTRQCIRAPVQCVGIGSKGEHLAGAICVIPNADPGYDWLLGRNIAGLITAFGGVNSHMAIRAAEFGLPAAIGIGEAMHEKIKAAKHLELDCAGRTIRIIAGAKNERPCVLG